MFQKKNRVIVVYVIAKILSPITQLSVHLNTVAANGLHMQRCRKLANHYPTCKPYLKYKLRNQHITGNDAYAVLWVVASYTKPFLTRPMSGCFFFSVCVNIIVNAFARTH